MIRGFLKHSAIYSIGIFLTKGISFLLLPLYTHVLTPADYGLINLLSSIAALFVPFLSLELTQAIGIYYSENKDIHARQQYLSTAFWFMLVTNLLYLAVFCGIAQHVQLWSSVSNTLLVTVFVATVITTLFAHLQNQLLWQQRSFCYAMINLISVVVTIVFTLLFVLKYKWGVVGVFLASLLGNLCGGIISFIYNRPLILPVFDRAKFKQLVRFSLPFIPSNLSFYSFLYIDQLVVNHYFGISSAGIYGVACRFVVIVNLILYAVGNALPPLVFRQHSEEQTKVSLEFITRLFVVFAIIVVLGLLLAGQDFILLFTTPAYLGAAKIISVLAIATFLINLHIFVPGLIINKKSITICCLNIGVAITNLLLCLYLAPKWGLLGAAIATLTSASLYAISYFLLATQYYRVKYPAIRYGLVIVVFGFCYLLFFHAHLTFSAIIWFDLIVKGLLLFAIGILLLLLAASYSEWQHIVGKRIRILAPRVFN